MKHAVRRLGRRLLPFPVREWMRRQAGNRALLFFARLLASDSVGLRSVGFATASRRAVVLGNGPSLSRDIEALEARAAEFDFVCVNNFSTSPHYRTLRPRIYVLLDSYFFSPNTHPNLIAQREATLSAIDTRTDWPLQIFLSAEADASVLRSRIGNPNVTIIKLNLVGIELARFATVGCKLFDSGYFGPPPINVLLHAIYIALWAGYRTVHVCGADMSLHHDVDVDQRSNDLLITYRYFDRPERVEPLRKNPDKIGRWTLAEFLDLSARTFAAHHVLERYARHRGIALLNSSSRSLIDAYPRLRIEDEAASSRADGAGVVAFTQLAAEPLAR